MIFDLWLVYGILTKDVTWIRLGYFGIGLSIKRTPLLYSERAGYKKYMSLPFGWRVIYLHKSVVS